MRITTNMQNKNLLSTMLNKQTDITDIQKQLASGNKINSASDNPTLVNSILNAGNTLDKITTYQKNISNLESEASLTDNVLGQISTALQRTKELTISAANATNSPTQLNAIKTEMEQIKEQIIDLGNTKYQGSYIFAGNKTNTTPFSLNDDGSITYEGTPSDEEYKRNYTIADGISISINFAGDSVLGYSNLVSEGPPAEYEGEGLLHTINTLTNLLGAEQPDYDKIREQIDVLDANQTAILNTRTTIGGIENRLNMTKEQHDNNKITYSELKSDLQEVDISEIVTELSSQQVALQYSLYAATQISNISILDYM